MTPTALIMADIEGHFSCLKPF